MSGLKTVTAWTTNVVSIADFKLFARIDSSDVTENALIESLVFLAQDMAESYTGRAITTQTLQLFLDRLPFYQDERLAEGVFTAPDLQSNPNYIVLPKPNLISVTHVKHYNNDNTSVTFTSTNYYVDESSQQGRIVLKNGVSWPTASELRNANAYEVQYVAGYGNTATDVPKPLVQAIKMLALHLYENREIATGSNVNMIPNTVAMLFAPYKVQRLNNFLGA
jgi:hypothetical protein|tara:strand:- start:701 stop:1366 length:666 start_codon:yes stop_codon:yes gene_type:complete